MDKPKVTYTISLNFEEINLPPFQDILVVGKNNKQGKLGLSKSFDLMMPEGFESIEIKEGNVDFVLINKRILAKIEKKKVLNLLSRSVFPFTLEGELVKVDFKVNVAYSKIKIEEE